MNATNEPNGSKWSPPYTSFQTLLNTVNRMAQEGGVPSQIDRSYLSNMPGSVRAAFLGSLRSLGLIDNDAKPTSALIALVDAGDDEAAKRQLVGNIIVLHYTLVVGLPAMATQTQLENVFRDYGVSGSTLRKAIAFYLGAARYAGLTVSPHFRVPKDASASEPRGARTQRRTVSVPKRQATTAAPPVAHDPVLHTPATHPLIAGLIRELPAPGDVFPTERQEAWFAIAKATFTLLYPTDANASRHTSSRDEVGGDSD